jgi:hypothetical protein
VERPHPGRRKACAAPDQVVRRVQCRSVLVHIGCRGDHVRRGVLRAEVNSVLMDIFAEFLGRTPCRSDMTAGRTLVVRRDACSLRERRRNCRVGVGGGFPVGSRYGCTGLRVQVVRVVRRPGFRFLVLGPLDRPGGVVAVRRYEGPA